MSYKKPIQITKSFTGISRNNLTNEFINDISINLNGIYERAYTIDHFKLINRLSGSIGINDKQYDIFGLKINGQDGKKYIGATASEDGISKYFIFIMDDFNKIVLSEITDDRFTSTIVAPSSNVSEFTELLDNLVD